MTLLSSSAFNEATGCLKKYHYHQVERLTPKPSRLSVPIRRGTWIHAALEAWDKGQDWALLLGRMEQWALDYHADPEKIADLRVEVDRIVHAYIEYWGKAWRLLESEVALTLETASGHTIRATLDAIVKDQNGVWIVERKTTGEIPPANWRGVDPQTAIQMLVALKAGYKVTGIIFDYILTKVPPRPRVKKNGEFYAGEFVTTSTVWDEAEAEHRDQPGYNPDYWASKRRECVNDGFYFQRVPVFKNMAVLKETAADIRSTLRSIERAEADDHWPRSFHVIGCRRFCSYSQLCMNEYLTGKPSEVLRREDFVTETEEIRYQGGR